MVFALRDLAVTAVEIGLIIGLGGISALAGASLAAWLARVVGFGPAMILAVAASGAAGLFIPAAGLVEGPARIALLCAQQLFGDGFGVAYLVLTMTLRQTLLPEFVLARVMGAFHAIAAALLPLGALLAGALAVALGTQGAFWVGAVIGLCAAVPLVASPLRRLRALPSGSRDADVFC